MQVSVSTVCMLDGLVRTLSFFAEQLIDLDHQCRDQIMFQKKPEHSKEPRGRDMAFTYCNYQFHRAGSVTPGLSLEAGGPAFS